MPRHTYNKFLSNSLGVYLSAISPCPFLMCLAMSSLAKVASECS